MLEDEPLISVIGTFRTASQLITAITDRHVDTVLIESGDESAAVVETTCPAVRIVCVGASQPDGTLSMHADRTHLIAAVRGVPHHATGVVKAAPAGCEAVDVLTPRQLEVLDHVSRGAAASDVGRALGIAVKTVEHHMHNAFTRLGAVSQAHAVARCLELGLLPNAGAGRQRLPS